VTTGLAAVTIIVVLRATNTVDIPGVVVRPGEMVMATEGAMPARAEAAAGAMAEAVAVVTVEAGIASGE
jgi:hypothetical protein